MYSCSFIIKMILYKSVAIFVLVSTVSAGFDLDLATRVVACIQQAITRGVGNYGIPAYLPYRNIEINVSWKGDFLGDRVNVEFINLTWADIPYWHLTANQTSDDFDSLASFDFMMTWLKFQLNGTLEVEVEQGDVKESYRGDMCVNLIGNTWVGKLELAKNGEATDFKFNWTVGDVDLSVNGFGDKEDYFKNVTAFIVRTGLNDNTFNHLITNHFDNVWKEWWPTGKIWDVCGWCDRTTSMFKDL